FCSEHSPAQEVEATREEDTACLLCTDPVEDLSYRNMVCPACVHAWFHRECIQGQALRSGLFFFRCPNCRDTETFLPEMLNMGIRVPIR
ncbi:G2E3 ligase, partial [Todus mexicanus]|nr:G2E3 ligase [Todus mexicanus]